MKKVVLYSMKGCPHCEDVKNILNDQKIKFQDRDIDVYTKEYNLFSEAVGNDYVPGFMLLTFKDKKNVDNVILMAPDRDFETVDEAVNKIEYFLKKV